jgi:tetratricopeptide (TPR) repeat protein
MNNYDDYSEDDELWKLVEGVNDLSDDVSVERVIKYYDDALKIKPDHPVLLYNKGDFLFGIDKYEDAMKLMDQIIEIDSNYLNALLLKSWILSIIGKTEESKKYGDRAEKIKSKKSTKK